LIGAILAVAGGQETRQARPFVHPLTNMPESSDDVVTTFYYPKHPDLRFPAGELVTVLCLIRNKGNTNVNITAVMGSLNVPQDFSYHLQNYTFKQFGSVLEPNREVTLDYTFQLHESLDPTEYQLAHTVFYDDGESAYSTTFFNKTVEIYLPPMEIDWGSILKTIIVLAGIGGVVFMTLLKKPEKSIPTEVNGKKVNDDWTDGYLGTAPKKGRKAKKN